MDVCKDNPEILRRRLAAQERELESMRRFSKLRSEMASNITKVEKEMRRKYAMANTLELLIVMECTASMNPWIEEAKSSIISIIDGMKKDHPKAYVRVGFVAYRGFCDGVNRLQVHSLTTDVSTVRTFIASLRAFGGGDGPEDIPGGLAAALEMSFQAEAKRIVLVSDASCHGSTFNDGGGDMTYRVQIEQSPDICAQMREMAKRGIDFTFIEIQPTYTAKMVALLQEAFGSAEIQDGFEREFKTVHLSDASDVVRFASVVRSSASASIAASKGRSLISSSKIAMGVSTYRHYGPTGRLTTRLPHVLEEGEEDESEEKEPVKTSSGDHLEMKALNWSEVDSSPGIEAVRHSLHFRPNEDIDWKKLDLKHTQQETRIRLDRNYFAKGAMRSAHAMFDCNMEQYFVAKVYYGKVASVANAKSLKSDVEMQIVAKQLATEFSLSDKVENAVDFIFTWEYKKYNNNNGWINDDGLDLSDTAQAFSHFTWQKTYIQLMVVDLQGVGCIFTDPQIHSKQGEKFGCGNLSDAGMAAFFVTHKCNEVCRALRLMPAKRLKSGSKTASTSEIVETKEESAKKAANKSMTCSCPLCVGITTVLHIDFIKAHRKGREIYCEACVVKKDKYETRVCCLCKKGNVVFALLVLDERHRATDELQTCKADAAKTKVRKSKPKTKTS